MRAVRSDPLHRASRNDCEVRMREGQRARTRAGDAMRFRIFSAGVQVAEERTITVAFERARTIAYAGSPDVTVEDRQPKPGDKVTRWRWTPGRGFLPL